MMIIDDSFKKFGESVPITIENLESVVRCMDCKYYSTKQSFNTDDFECYECLVLKRYLRPDDFCSYGERKEE